MFTAARQLQSLQPLVLLTVLFAAASASREGTCRAQPAPNAKANITTISEATKVHVAAGVDAFERGDTAAAQAFFNKALLLNPDEVTAHTYLGIMADGAGDLREAERHFSAAAMADPWRASARNNYGAILLRTGRLKLAAVQFEASLKLDRQQPSALVNLAQIRFASGTPADLAAAADLFARAYAIRPDVDVARAIIVIALRRQDNAAASTRYRDYAAQLAAASGAAAHTQAARAELGAALFEAGLLPEAEAELTAAVELNHADTESTVRLARAQLARKDVPAAGRTLELSVARGHDSAPLYALLAEVYKQAGRIENAIPAMRLAIQRDPRAEKYRFSYGLLLVDAYAPAAAAIRLEEALKVFPESPRLWFALGLSYFKLDKDVEATNALRRAAALDAKFGPPFAYLGMMRAKAGAYAEAVALYQEALRADARLAPAHYLIAEALLKQTSADASRVESHLRRAVELDPTFTPARLSLGRYLMRAERWADAVAELEKAAAVDPEVAEAYYQLGRAYARLKRQTEAQAALATFKRLTETQKAREDAELRDVVKRLGSVNF